MANNLQNIERLNLNINSATSRQYAETASDAVDAIREQQNSQKGNPGVGNSPITTDDRYFNQGNIRKGIHEKYVNTRIQHFGWKGSDADLSTAILRNSYTSFSGADTTVTVLFKYGKPVIIGEVQTVTYSLYTPTNPVYNLGSHKPSGYVRGPRTIAGTIIFTVFDRHALISAFHYAYDNYMDVKCLDKDYLSDELPPFHLQISFLNEYGQSSVMTIYDVRITTEGQTMSIEDLITENTMQYMASDIRLMEPDYVQEPY